jgi:O-antigen/teichoic acid export membrane protein
MEDPVEPEAGAVTMDRGELQRRAASGALWTLIHVLLSVPVAFLANVVIARVLGTSDYGRLAFLTAVQGVAASVLGLGSGAALIQFGSKAYAAGRRGDVDAMVSRVQGLQLLVTLPLLTLVMLLVAQLPTDLMVVLVVFGVFLPTAIGVALDCMLIENRSARSAQVALIASLSSQVLAVGMAIVVRSADSVWAARLAVGGLSIVGSLFLISSRHRRAVLRPRLPVRLPPGFWSFALLTMVTSVVAGLVLSRSEVFVLQWLGTPESVGIFALAFGLTAHMFAPAQALIGPLTPALAALHQIESRETVRTAFERTLRTTSAVSGAAVAALAAPVGLLVPALYGRQYADASPIIVVLAALGAVTMLAAPLSAFVLARLSAASALRANAAALVVDLVAAVALVPSVGVWGAVVANVLGAVTLLGLLLRVEARALEIGLRAVSRVVRATVLGSAASVVAYLVGGRLSCALLAALIALTVGLVVFWALIRLTRSGITPGDSTVLVQALPTRLRGSGRAALRLVVTET